MCVINFYLHKNTYTNLTDINIYYRLKKKNYNENIMLVIIVEKNIYQTRGTNIEGNVSFSPGSILIFVTKTRLKNTPTHSSRRETVGSLHLANLPPNI